MATARRRPKMASLLREELFEARGQAPAPSKDFCQLLVTRRQVIFRWWKISLRNEFREARPGEIKESHQDFLDDSSLQIQIAIVFGAKVLEHVLNLCRGNYDFLERLPVPLLLYIISFLELEDIARLSQVSHRFKMFNKNRNRTTLCSDTALLKSVNEKVQSIQLLKGEVIYDSLVYQHFPQICNSNTLWESIVENLCDTLTPEMRELAQEMGWKQFFFTNRLQLQLQLRRRRQKHADKEKLPE